VINTGLVSGALHAFLACKPLTEHWLSLLAMLSSWIADWSRAVELHLKSVLQANDMPFNAQLNEARCILPALMA
jgi:hypothetical protein